MTMDSYQRDVRMLTVEILRLMNTESHTDEELQKAKSALEEAARALRHEKAIGSLLEGETRSLEASEPRPVAAC